MRSPLTLLRKPASAATDLPTARRTQILPFTDLVQADFSHVHSSRNVAIFYNLVGWELQIQDLSRAGVSDDASSQKLPEANGDHLPGKLAGEPPAYFGVKCSPGLHSPEHFSEQPKQTRLNNFSSLFHFMCALYNVRVRGGDECSFGYSGRRRHTDSGA